MATGESAGAALVLYEDGYPDIERTARTIAESLGAQGIETRLRAASEATIPDLLAASLLVLGAQTPLAAPYAEVAGALAGMNLAGRKAAFFGSSGAAVARLRAICVETEVAAAHSDLVGLRVDGPSIAAWLRGIL